MHEQTLRIDADRTAALDILLLLADAEARWNNHERALDLLDVVEEVSGHLAPEYRMKQRRWDLALGGGA